MNGNEPASADAVPAAPRTASPLRTTLTWLGQTSLSLIGHLRKLKKDKSPAAAIARIEESLAANSGRRTEVAARVEHQHAAIVAKRAEHARASKARQRILEAELATLLSAYRATERELTVLLENERVLSQTKGRLLELTAYDSAGVGENQLDEIIDDLQERVAAAEGRLDAARDLEKAGRRRDRESDREDLWQELKEFETETLASAAESLSLDDFETHPATSPQRERAEAAREE